MLAVHAGQRQGGDGVGMAFQGMQLHPMLQVPHTYAAVLSARDSQPAIPGQGQGGHLVAVAGQGAHQRAARWGQAGAVRAQPAARAMRPGARQQALDVGVVCRQVHQPAQQLPGQLAGVGGDDPPRQAHGALDQAQPGHLRRIQDGQVEGIIEVLDQPDDPHHAQLGFQPAVIAQQLAQRLAAPGQRQVIGQPLEEIAILRPAVPGPGLGQCALVGLHQPGVQRLDICALPAHVIALQVVQQQAALLVLADQRARHQQLDPFGDIQGIQPLSACGSVPIILGGPIGAQGRLRNGDVFGENRQHQVALAQLGRQGFHAHLDRLEQVRVGVIREIHPQTLQVGGLQALQHRLPAPGVRGGRRPAADDAGTGEGPIGPQLAAAGQRPGHGQPQGQAAAFLRHRRGRLGQGSRVLAGPLPQQRQGLRFA